MANIINKFVVNTIIPYFKSKRWQLFIEWHTPQKDEVVLDLGGGDGSALAKLYPYTKNIILADIDKAIIESGTKRYGLKDWLLLEENGVIPLETKSVDIVFCNSVIEHVTVDKQDEWNIRNGKMFKKLALERQSRLASEIIRTGRKYWIQTPYKHFPFETHTWLPFIQYFPRPLQILMISHFNRFWVKRTSPDFYLLSKAEACLLFPDSEIIFERFLGLPKSLIIRSPKP
ncbi:MAG: class I SAM-dependent methyltransferase [Methanothrix sp.]|nr:class I SAM-dependent methyltransferase [Methanothrix sp.]